MPNWTMKDIPPQAGRRRCHRRHHVASAMKLPKHWRGDGAKVIIASRNESKGAESAGEASAPPTPGADVAFEPLDLASLDPVAGAATRIAASVPRIDLLINNAGVMAIPDET